MANKFTSKTGFTNKSKPNTKKSKYVKKTAPDGLVAWCLFDTQKCKFLDLSYVNMWSGDRSEPVYLKKKAAVRLQAPCSVRDMYSFVEDYFDNAGIQVICFWTDSFLDQLNITAHHIEDLNITGFLRESPQDTHVASASEAVNELYYMVSKR